MCSCFARLQELIYVWNTTYIHDLMVHECTWQNRSDFYLFGASITDDTVYIINVTDPTNFDVINVYPTRQGKLKQIDLLYISLSISFSLPPYRQMEMYSCWVSSLGAAHNIWVDRDCTVMYVTHERAHEPITVWEFRVDEGGLPRMDASPQYRVTVLNLSPLVSR